MNSSHQVGRVGGRGQCEASASGSNMSYGTTGVGGQRHATIRPLSCRCRAAPTAHLGEPLGQPLVALVRLLVVLEPTVPGLGLAGGPTARHRPGRRRTPSGRRREERAPARLPRVRRLPGGLPPRRPQWCSRRPRRDGADPGPLSVGTSPRRSRDPPEIRRPVGWQRTRSANVIRPPRPCRRSQRPVARRTRAPSTFRIRA